MVTVYMCSNICAAINVQQYMCSNICATIYEVKYFSFGNWVCAVVMPV
jgi:hypothetical protein